MPYESCKPGQIYKIWLDGDTPKFVIVVSREELNRGEQCITVMLTTQKVAERSRLDNYVYFKAGEFGLTKNCVAQCESLTGTSYTWFDDDVGLVGTLDADRWEELVDALGDVLGAVCYAKH
jgi:mRNA-degrading endonuclease toxin of MazEF toxin-antitoxin module